MKIKVKEALSQEYIDDLKAVIDKFLDEGDDYAKGEDWYIVPGRDNTPFLGHFFVKTQDGTGMFEMSMGSDSVNLINYTLSPDDFRKAYDIVSKKLGEIGSESTVMSFADEQEYFDYLRDGKSRNEEFYKGDDRGFLVLVQRMIEDIWYPKVRKAVKNVTFDCYEMDVDDFVICFEANGDGVDESTADILQDLADNAVKAGCDKANRSTDPSIADYGLDADYVAWDEPELFHNQWSYAVNLSSKPKNTKSESADESAPEEVDTVLKKNAPGLIDILNDEFKKAGSDAYLTLPYPDQPKFSDGWYLKVKSAGKWDDRSRKLNLKLMGKEYNGVIYKDGEIYLKAGSRPMSHRGTAVNLFTESADEKLSYEKGHKNSKGEDAPWVIRSHEDNRILASFANKSNAKEHLGRMKQYSEQESMNTTIDLDKYIKDVKAILKSKYDMDVDDKETSLLCSGWMDKLDAMHHQGKSVEDCAKAVAKFCGFTKDNESLSESDGEMTEEAVLSLIDKLGLEVVNKWFDGNKSRPVFDCRDRGDDESGETVCVAVEPPYEARVWFKDVNPRVNHYTDDIITIGDLEDTLKEFFHIDADESKTTEDEGWDALRKLSKRGELPYGNNMRTDGLSLSRIADEIRYDVATAMDMEVEACEDAMLDYGYDRIYVAIADGKTPEEVAADIKDSKKTESSDDDLRSRMEKVGNELLENGDLHSWEYDFIKECLAFSEYKKLEQYLIRKGLYNPPTEAKKSEGIKLEFQDTLRVPMWLWHAYNFNDTSDLTDEEIEKFNQFKEEYKDCHLDDKGEESYFSSRNDFDDLGGPVYDVDVYKMTYKNEKKSDRKGYAPYYFCMSKYGDGKALAVLADADSIHYLPCYDKNGNKDKVDYSVIATSFEPMDNPESSKLYDIVQSKDGRNIVILTMAEFDDFADVDSHTRGDWFKALLRKRNLIEKKSEALSSKSTYPFSFKFKFASPRVVYALRDEVDNGDYKGANLNCSDDDASECEVFTDSPKVIYDLLENVCKRYNETYDGDLIPDDLKNKFQIGFGLVKTDDPNLDDTALRFGVAINTRQPDGVMVSGELDNVVDFLDEMK